MKRIGEKKLEEMGSHPLGLGFLSGCTVSFLPNLAGTAIRMQMAKMMTIVSDSLRVGRSLSGFASFLIYARYHLPINVEETK